ncbi:MAG: AbrB/MazE/SpoVT family DNA-binding domain-containing protein [Blastocatellales bacterium]|nr:AbrB/MazE/SpoVT family DNA-binding domain-containing protein [Blastocatellales bacterium]
MVAKIQKWGNSQGLRLAKHILEDAGISIGDDVEIIVGEKEIRIVKKSRPKFILEEMVSKMPKNYIAVEESFGPPMGKEAW